MGVSTGTVVGGLAGCGTSENHPDVLFDGTSTSEFSRAFVVSPGSAVVLSAFNLARPYVATVQKMKFASGGMPSGSACEGGGCVGVALREVDEVSQCGLWQLTACSNLRVLSVPGMYRLELTPAAVGETYVELKTLSADEARLIPMDLYFGTRGGDCSPCSGKTDVIGSGL